MTGIERLRRLSETEMSLGYPSAHSVLSAIAEQIEREQVEAAADHAVVASVISEMERHVLGHEGMEDSPVARWARELRGALGGREHDTGGLDAARTELDNLRGAVKETCTRIGVEHTGDLTQDAQTIWREIEALRSRLKESVPRAAYERHLARRQRQIYESHAALRRRNRRIAELERSRAGCASDRLKADAALYELQRAVLDQCKAFGVDVSECDTAFDMLHDMNEALSKRLMPEGMEWLVEAWPRFEDGEPVRIGDEYECWCGNTHEVNSVTIREGCSMINATNAHSFVVSDGPITAHGKRVKRTAPKVLDADGAEIRVGDTVWHVHDLDKFTVTNSNNGENLSVSCMGEDGKEYCCYPNGLTHRAPVLAADGEPLREGETVWSTDSGTRYTVEKVTDELIPIKCCSEMGSTVSLHPSQLTHERPDSWERLEEDVANVHCADYCTKYGIDHSDTSFERAKARDIVRRAKALAERDA